MQRRNPGWLKRLPVAGIAPFLLLAASSGVAQQTHVTLDPAQTKISWTLGATMHTVHGSFKLVSGNITFDPGTGNASGEILVDAKSGESGNSSRDSKMQKDVLESARFPEITFFPKHVSGSLSPQGSSTLQVQGVLRIHGADHNVTLSLPVQMQGMQGSATATFDVPYQEWGMKNPSNFFVKVDNKVQIGIVAVATVGKSSIPATGSR